MIAVLPIDKYEDPELAGLVEICAWIRRSSFQRRPSRRSLVRGYVVEVSSGILAEQFGRDVRGIRKRGRASKSKLVRRSIREQV